MSYEGYDEHLCKNGHYWSVDCYMEADDEKCRYCGEPSVWRHAVDETNGEVEMDDGTICPSTTPWPLEVDHYEEKMVTQRLPIYKIPNH